MFNLTVSGCVLYISLICILTFTFWVLQYHKSERIPLLVAAGGGGLAHGPFVDNGKQHGNGINVTLPNITAPSIGTYPAGEFIPNIGL